MSKTKKTLNTKRIHDIFNDSLRDVSMGKKPNVSKKMREKGYSESSARALRVTKTKTWQELLNEINDQEILDTFYEIMTDKQDKRARIAAAQELAKLKDRYPDKKHKITLYDEREEVTE